MTVKGEGMNSKIGLIGDNGMGRLISLARLTVVVYLYCVAEKCLKELGHVKILGREILGMIMGYSYHLLVRA